jgi:hypothetical protein
MYYTKHTKLTDTAEVALFEVPRGYHALITFVFAANHSGNPGDATVKWTDNETVPNDLMYIFDDVQIAATDNVTLGGQSQAPIFVLHEGEVVRCSAGQVGDIEIAVTFELQENAPSLVNFV